MNVHLRKRRHIVPVRGGATLIEQRGCAVRHHRPVANGSGDSKEASRDQCGRRKGSGSGFMYSVHRDVDLCLDAGWVMSPRRHTGIDHKFDPFDRPVVVVGHETDDGVMDPTI